MSDQTSTLQAREAAAVVHEHNKRTLEACELWDQQSPLRDGQLLVWHNSRFGRAPFYYKVPNVWTALLVLDVLAMYDLYQGDRVAANAAGLVVHVAATNELDEWYDFEGNNLRDIERQISAGEYDWRLLDHPSGPALDAHIMRDV